MSTYSSLKSAPELRGKTQNAIVTFFKKRKIGSQFSMNTLLNFVYDKDPASSDENVTRTLRKLRERNVVDYQVGRSKKTGEHVYIIVSTSAY